MPAPKAAADSLMFITQRPEVTFVRGQGEVRGAGLLLALELGRPVAAQVVAAALARGLLINAPRPTALRFMPALNVTRQEIDEMIGLLREAIGDGVE